METTARPPCAPQSLAIGCFAAICRHRLGDRLLAFSRAYPQVEVGVTEMNRAELLRGVRDGSLALAVMPGGPRGGFDSVELWPDRAAVAVAATHRWAALATVPAAALAGERILLPRGREEADLHAYLAARIAVGALDTALASAPPGSVADDVAAGAGVALTCTGHAPDARDGLVVRPLDGQTTRFLVSAYWATATPHPALAALIRAIRHR